MLAISFTSGNLSESANAHDLETVGIDGELPLYGVPERARVNESRGRTCPDSLESWKPERPT